MNTARLALSSALTLAALSLAACAPEPGFDSHLHDHGVDEKGYYLSTSIWSSPVIEVCWENPSTANARYREITKEAAISSWERVSRVRFVGWDTCAASSNGIRIRWQDTGPHVKALGDRLDGRSNGMVLNHSFNNWSTSCQGQEDHCVATIAVHEFGHAIGIAHEQNRDDTPSTCTDAPQGTDGDTTVGDWDLDSVMNYCNPTWAGHGELSEGDVITVRQMYGSRIGQPDLDKDGVVDLTTTYDVGSYRYWMGLPSDGSASFADLGDWTATTTPDVEVIGFADVDGDQRQDIIFQYDWNGTRRWQARLSDGGAFHHIGDWASTTELDAEAVALADVDRDGLDDLVIQYDSGGSRYWKAMLSDGTQFVDSGTWTSTTTSNVEGVDVKDVTGDGRADLVIQFDHGGTRYWQVRASNGSDFSTISNWKSVSASTGWEYLDLADMDADGLIDLLLIQTTSSALTWQANLSTGSDFSGGTFSTYTTNPLTAEHIDVIDVNGDAMADLVLQYDYNGTRRWQVRASQGTSFASASNWASTSTPGVEAIQLADYTGDGLNDLLLQADIGSERRWQVRASTGSSFTHNGNWFTEPTSTGMAFLDAEITY